MRACSGKRVGQRFESLRRVGVAGATVALRFRDAGCDEHAALTLTLRATDPYATTFHHFIRSSLMIPSFRKSLASLKNDLAAKRGQQHARRRRSAMSQKHPLAAQQEALEARQLLSAIQVTTDADSGTGSLREAIATANANKQADTITFASSVTSITLTGGELVLSETGPGNRTTIKGPVSISGNNASRIFTVKLGVFAELSSLTLTNGRATGDGGAIDSQGELAVIGTTVKDSFATGKSGAIQLTAGTLDIVNSTLSGNRADQWGGAIGANGGQLTVTSSTLTNNKADTNGDGTGDGGALSFPPQTVVSLFNSILAGNSSGSGTADDMTGGTNLHKDSSNNLIGSSSVTLGLAHGTKGNLLGNNGSGVIDINTVLDTTLKDNGGSAFTHSLIAGSPALDAGDASRFRLSVTTDQNGKPRVDGDGIDIGAFEAAVQTAPNSVDVDGVRFVSTGNFSRPLKSVTASGDAIVATGGGNVATHTQPGNALDGNPDTKYFQDSWTSAPGLIITPTAGATTVEGLKLTTADDVPGRDPASYKLEGSNSPSGPFTLIAEGSLNLPSARKTAGSAITFNNTTAYTSYRVTFPTLKDTSISQVQIAEIELQAADATQPKLFESGGRVQLGNVPLGGAAFVPSLELRSGVRITTSAGGVSTFSTTGLISTITQGRSLELMSGVVDGDTNQRILIPVKSLTSSTGYTINQKQANTFRLSANESFTASRLLLPQAITTVADITGPGDTVTAFGGGQVSNGEGAPEAIDNDPGRKYRHFQPTHPAGLIVTPAKGATVVEGLRLTTANDLSEDDPASYRLEGRNGTTTGAFTKISEGALTLPTDRNKVGPTVSFSNTIPYTAYRLTFLTARGSGTTVQVAEVELLGKEFVPKGPLAISGRLGFDAFGGAGVRLEGTNNLSISPTGVSAQIQAGILPGAAASYDKAGKPAPISFELAGMDFDANSLTGTFDSANDQFEFQGVGTTIFDGGVLQARFGFVDRGLTIKGGIVTAPPSAEVVDLSAGGVVFTGDFGDSDVTKPGDPVVGIRLHSGTAPNAIDDSSRTNVLSTHGTNFGLIVTPAVSTVLTAIRVPGDPFGSGSSIPSEYVLEGGSSAVGPWTPISSGSVSSNAVNQGKISFKNTLPYTTYRLIFPKLHAGGTQFNVSEIEFIGHALAKRKTLFFDGATNTISVRGNFTASSPNVNLGVVGFGTDVNPGDADPRVGTELKLQNGKIAPFSLPLTTLKSGRLTFTNRNGTLSTFMQAEFSPDTGEFRVSGDRQRLTYDGDLSTIGNGTNNLGINLGLTELSSERDITVGNRGESFDGIAAIDNDLTTLHTGGPNRSGETHVDVKPTINAPIHRLRISVSKFFFAVREFRLVGISANGSETVMAQGPTGITLDERKDTVEVPINNPNNKVYPKYRLELLKQRGAPGSTDDGARSLAEVEFLTVTKRTLVGTGLRIANGVLQDFTVPVEEFELARRSFKVDPLTSAANPFTLKFESKQERLSATGAATVSTFGTPDVILGGRGTDGVVIDFKTPQNSRFSYTYDKITYAGMPYTSADSAVSYDPKLNSGTGGFAYTGSGFLSFGNQKVRAIPMSRGFIVEGDIDAGGLIISTQGMSMEGFNVNGTYSGGRAVNLNSTIRIEGKAAQIKPVTGRLTHFFDFRDGKLVLPGSSGEVELITPLSFTVDGVKFTERNGAIVYPNTKSNPGSQFIYRTAGKVDFQVGDIKTKATVSIPLNLKNGGLTIANGSTYNLDQVTIQNVIFQDGAVKATYSEKDRRYVFVGKGSYLGLKDVTFGADPTGPQIILQRGVFQLKNFTPPVVDVVAAGVTFPTKGLTRNVVGQTVTLTGSKTIDVGGAQIAIELGGGGSNGLVINGQNGTVQEISGTLSGSFTVGGVEISATGTLNYLPADKELRITGAASFAFNTTTGPVNVDINLGHGGTPGLVIKDGQIQSIQASLTTDFTLFGLEIDIQTAGFSYDRAKQEYGIFGTVTISTPDKGGERILDNFSVSLGAPDTPGLIIRNGEVEFVDIALNGTINLFGINATPENLRITYWRSQDLLVLRGGLTVTIAGKFTAKAAFPGRGLEINTRTGEVQIKGLELRVQDVKFGTLEIRDLGFIYEVDDQGNTTISGSGEITLPAGLTVGAEVVVKNNRLKKIGFKIERSPGIPLGHPPVVFLNSIEGEIDNLDDLNNFSIKAKVTGTVGPSVKIFGQTRALVTIEGSIDINKDRMIIRGDVDLLEGIMGEGSGSITIFFKGKEVVHVTANFRLYPGGVFRGNLDFRMDRDFNITLNGNLGFYVPDPVPVVGGESLGNFGIYLQIRPKQRRENSYIRVRGDVTLAEFEVTVNFAGRLDGWAEPPILSRKHFGFYLPGARDLDFLLPLSEGNFDAIDALTEVPAPELTIDGVTPDTSGAGATITYSGTSQLPDNTIIDLFVDTVDSGFNGHLIAGGLAFQDGLQTFDWDDMAAFAPVPYDPNTKLYVYGLISDGTNIPVFTNYSAAITPPDLTPSIAMPTEQTFGANQPLVFSNNTSNAIVVADPLAQHNADSELVVTLHAGNGFLTLDPQKATPWQNISNPQDVDDDGGTSVSDALQIITMLNSPTMQNDNGTLPAQRSSLFGTPMYDVNGDGKVTAADAQGLTDSLLGGASGTVTTTLFDNVEVTGDGTGSITLIGKAADINKVLDGLTYEPIENAFFDDTLTTTVNRNPEFYIDTLSASTALKPRALTVGTADGVEALPVAYVQGSGHASLLESVQVSSAAAGYIGSATISIGGFEAGKDVLELNILDQQELGIDATFDAASGMLRLTGFARVEEYRQAIGLVTFCSHGTGERMLTVTLGDQAANVGAAGVKVRITAVNQAPVVLPGMGGTYIAGSGASLALLPSISVRDSDSMTLESATIILDAASFKEGEDVLSYDAMDGITGTFNAMKGELELTGSASAADYSAALLRIKYRNTSTAATTGIREISITVSDGHRDNSTTTVHQRLLVVSANTTLQGVTLGGLPTETVTTANDDGTFTLAPQLTLTDNDMVVDTLMGVDIAITGNFMPGDDFLDVVGLPVGMDSSYDVMSGVLSITGAVPVDWYEYMLQQVTYSNRSMVRDGVARTISFTVHDGFTKGIAESMTVQAEAVPVIETGLGALVYESGKGSEVIDANIAVMYKGNTTLTGATVEFTWDFNADQDRLVFTDQNGITGSFDEATGLLTLAGTASVANYQTALRSVQYMNTRTNPIAGLRQLAVQIQDGQKFSDEASLQINVDTVYVAPTIAITTTEQTFDEGNAPILVAETFTIAQQDAAAADGRGSVMLDGATISIEGYVAGEDVLDFTPFQGEPDTNDPDDTPTNIVGEFDADLGQLLLTGHASLAEYQSVIRSITYENVSEAPTTDPRVIHIMMQAGALDGEAPAVTITVTSLNNPPTQLVAPPAEATLLENAIDSSLGLENIDYVPPSDKEPELVYTVTAVPDEALGHVEFNDGTIAEFDTTYTLEQLRSAAFVPALNASGEGQFSFTAAGFNPILGIPDPAQLSESIDIKVNGVLTDHPSDAFIAQLHRDLLGRNATQEELDFFDDDQEVHIQRLNAVAAVQESREYRDAFVTGIYQRLLNRGATAEELDAWSEPSSISLGDLPSLNEVLPTVMSSDEYFTVRGADSYDLFVDAIFEDLLTRLPTDLERENEVGLLEDGVERSEIVTAINDSDEASAIVVKEVIGSLLRRAGGQFEVVDFARLLQDNGREWLVNHFAASDEYFIRYGIQENADSRNAEDIHADLVHQWLAGEATVGNSVVTTDFEATGTLAIDGRGRGGGTLIASEYVLTAAHLVDGRDVQSLRFTVGGTSYGVSAVHVHDGYALGFLGTDDGNDLAVLKLNRPVVDVAPAALWQHELQTGIELTLVGFGPHPGDEGFGTKRSGTTTVDGLSPRLVTWTYDNADEATTVPGDSGSPQFILHDGTYYLASVASGGTHQALSLGDFAYNTRVDSYTAWIANIVRWPSPAVGSSHTTASEGRHANGAAISSFVAFNTNFNVELSGNDLVVEDISTTGQANAFIITTTATDVVISDAQQLMTTDVTGATGTGTHTITVPLSAFTGHIIVQSTGGDDSIEVTTPSRLVDIDAGTGTNSLIVNGSSGAEAEEFFLRNSAVTAGSLEVEMPGTTAPGPYTVRAQNVANVTLNTGDGIDTVRPGDLSALTTAPQTLTINLGDGDDVLAGENGTLGLIVNGGDGNDTLTGGPGNDRLAGGPGDDTTAGGTGDDVYIFDVDDVIGADTITENASEGSDTLDFSPTQFTTVGIDLRTIAQSQTVDTNGNLQLTLSDDIENVTGGANGNAIIGDAGVNVLIGGDGIDFILGAGGDDQISGGPGQDTLRSDASGAILDGGTGPDITEFANVNVTFPTNLPATFDISGTAAGTEYDQVRVFGDAQTVTLGGVDLQLNLGNYTPQVNDEFTIVNLIASTSTISGTFNDSGQTLAEGATFVADGRQFRISYQGGDGNDVVLTFLQRLPGFTVQVASVAPTVSEAGSTETFTVVLDAQPASDVAINVSSSDTTEATVDKAVLTFTTANWNSPQTVTITGVDDSPADGNQTTVITLAIDDAASDDSFDSLADSTLSVVTTDDDTAAVFIVVGPVGAIETVRPTVSWTPVPGALSYNVFVNIDGNGGNVLTQRDVSRSQTSLTVTQDLEFARYRVFVEANMPNGVVKTQDQGHTFVVNVKAQLFPLGATTETQPVLSWTKVPGATSYEIYINVPGNPSTAIVTPVGSGNTVATMPATALPRNDYKWWVRPIRLVDGADYLGPWSEPSEFSTGGRTKIISPARNSTTMDNVPTLTWSAVPEAQSYEVYVSKIGTSGVLYRDVGITSTSLRTRTLENGVYKVWIRTTLADGSGVWGSGVEFTVDATTTAQQTTPIGPATPAFNTTSLLFTWQETNGAASYDLYLHNGTSAILETGITGSSWTPPTLLAESSWTWSIRPVSASGVGTWSVPTEFNTDGRTQVLTPGATTSDTMPTFTWQPVTNAVAYEVQVNNQTTDTADVIREAGLNSASFTPVAALTPGVYRVWARAISSTSTGPWSLPVEFEVVAIDAAASEGVSENLIPSILLLEQALASVAGQTGVPQRAPVAEDGEQRTSASVDGEAVNRELPEQITDIDEHFAFNHDWLSTV